MTFGLLWVSSGIGLGAMVKGEVLKGAHGAAGEVGYLPLGLDPFASRSRRRGSLEEAAGAAGVRATARRLRNDHPSTRLAARASVDQILAAAQDGDPLGRAVVDHEARLLALAIVAVTVTLDPACVVLGGGVGSHPVLAGPVQRYVDSLSPAPIEVRTSALGESAPLRGAQAVGHDVLIGELLASLSATHG